MADAELRRLARLAGQGEEEALLALLRQAVRSSLLPRERLELAGVLLGPAGEEALGAARASLPTHAFSPGARVAVCSAPRAACYVGGGEPRSVAVTAEVRCLDGPARGGWATVASAGAGDQVQLPDLLLELALLGFRRVGLDLRGVPRLDDWALASLAKAADELERDGGALVVVPSPALGQDIELLGLDPLIRLARAEDEARAALRALAPAAPLSPSEHLEQLLRFGTEGCVRAASAIARAEPAEDGPSAAGAECLAAAEAWAACPCPGHAAAVRSRVGDGRDFPLWLGGSSLGTRWAWHAGAAAVCGTWPRRLTGVTPAQEAAARRELVLWALGLADPVLR